MGDPESDMVTKSINTIIKQFEALDDVDPDETITEDIKICHVQGKARVAIGGPVGVDRPFERIHSMIRDDLTMQNTTDGEKIGELYIYGDGSIDKVEIKEEFEADE